MKKHKGFGAIEVIIIIAIIIAITGLAWYAFRSKPISTSLDMTNTPTPSSSTSQINSFTKISSGEQFTYVIEKNVIKYTPEKSWNVESKDLIKRTGTYKQGLLEGSITLTSPDYKDQSDGETDGFCPSENIVSGAKFIIYLDQDSTDYTAQKNIDDVLNGTIGSPGASSPKAIQISGIKGASYLSSPGECFTNFVTEVPYHGYSIKFSVDRENMNNPVVAKQYNEFISSVVLDK